MLKCLNGLNLGILAFKEFMGFLNIYKKFISKIFLVMSLSLYGFLISFVCKVLQHILNEKIISKAGGKI